MTRVLIALALSACIGSTAMAQTYRTLTATNLKLNSSYPANGTLTIQANAATDYSLTLPPSAPAAKSIMANGATAGTLEWTAPLDVYEFTNGLTESGTNTIKLGGTLSENTTLALATYSLTMSSASGGDVLIDVDQLTLKGTVGLNATGSGNTSIGNSSGTLSLASTGLNVSTAGVISDAGGDIEFAGNIVPSSAGNYSLGSDAVRWRNAFIGPESLHIGPADGYANNTQLLIGYNGNTNTASFDLDGTAGVVTLNNTDGMELNLNLNANDNVTLGDATSDRITIEGTIYPISGSTDGSSLVFEGATNDGFQTTFKIIDPTADRTLLFPDVDGMLAVTDLNGGVVIVGTLEVYQQTDLKGLVNLGDGVGDVIWVNTAGDADLRIEESEIRRLDQLTIRGSDATNTTHVASLQLAESVDLNSTDGDITFTAQNGGIDAFAFGVISLESGDLQLEGSGLYLDPNSPRFEMNKDQYFNGKLDIDGAAFRTVSLIADGYADGSAYITLQPTDGIQMSGVVTMLSLASPLNISLGANDRILVANSDGVIDQVDPSALVGSSAWGLSGNAGTTPGTTAGDNFIGTTDVQDLVFATNGTEVFRATSGGRIGIGTTTPSETLDVAGTVNISGVTTINTTNTDATTIGNGQATTSILGGFVVSLYRGGANMAVDNNYTVVIITSGAANDDVTFPEAPTPGRMVIVRNQSGVDIDIVDDAATPTAIETIADGVNRTYVYDGTAWVQIGN
jgi:hypothetical protein